VPQSPMDTNTEALREATHAAARRLEEAEILGEPTEALHEALEAAAAAWTAAACARGGGMEASEPA
jgi:hypothetical protein